MSVDAFDKVFQDWLHGIQWQEKVRQQTANMSRFVGLLQKRGHTVTCDYHNRRIFVDGELTVTMRVAQEIQPETLLKWIDMYKSGAKENSDG